MKPNAPGEWHSRDGQRIVVYGVFGSLRWRAVTESFPLPHGWRDLKELQGDDWLLTLPPEFPALPPKPRLAQCYAQRKVSGVRGWRVFNLDADDMLSGDLYIVVPHPDNDPEAVRLINKANGL